MYLLDVNGKRIELEPLPAPAPAFETVGRPDALRDQSPLVKASRAFFETGPMRGAVPTREAVQPGPPPVAFRERDTGLVRTFLREIVLRFRPGTPAATKAQVL
ncbi:MAG TPA: hypothetical protein VLF95_07640, partial [Vicinamibacteria bacterium]|nr:hypothetical protein [Vicinamibacteria bacterium]